jgi:hypothetical protein
MGHRHDGAVAPEALQRRVDRRLGLRVERGGCLVEQEDAWIADDGSRQRDPLALAAGQAGAALADVGLVALRQAGDEVVDLGGARGGFHVAVGRRRTAEADVLADRGVEQEAVLEDGAIWARSEPG